MKNIMIKQKQRISINGIYLSGTMKVRIFIEIYKLFYFIWIVNMKRQANEILVKCGLP